MLIQAVTLLVISVVLFLILVPLSYSIIGIWLSELGIWVMWVPLGMIGYELYQFFAIESQNDLLAIQGMLLVCMLFNSISAVRLIIPFVRVNATTMQCTQAMRKYLGPDYLHYITSSTNCVDFFSCVRFKITYYLRLRRKIMNQQVTTVKNLIYSEIDGKELKLNVHFPTADGKYPVIVFIHGGGWFIGTKDKPAHERTCKLLASLGYTVFNINYRLIPPEYIFTKKPLLFENPQLNELVSDVDCAIHYAEENAIKFKGNPEKIFLFGRSAGAHLALLTTFIPETYSKISGVIALYPVTDLEGFYNYYQEKHKRKLTFVGSSFDDTDDHKKLYKLFSPISYVNEDNLDNLPPVFLATGVKDRLVNPEQSVALFNRLQEIGIRSVLLELPWANHGFDQILSGPGGQLVFKYITHFLAWVIAQEEIEEIEAKANVHGLESVVSKEKIQSIHTAIEQNPNVIENVIVNTHTKTESYKCSKV